MTEEEREMHLEFMREALAMAEYALTHSETPVGCIFVHHPPSPSPSSTTSPPKPQVIARGYNLTNKTFNGTRHAEFIAINQLLSSRTPKYGPEILKECDLYVTVEPCIMCASLLRQFGIRKVFFGASNEKFGGTGGVLNVQRGNGRSDSFPKGCQDEDGKALGDGKESVGEEVKGGKGEEGVREGNADGNGKWEEGDYEVSGGWLREEAIVMLRRFYVQENERAPEEKRGKEGRVLRLDVEPLEVDVVDGLGKGREE